MQNEPLLANISIAGRKHRERNIPCEDASIAVTSNGVSVVCVADGAGGSKYTHAGYGSKAIVKCISDLLTQHFDAIYFEQRENLVKSIIVTAVQSQLAILVDEHKLSGLEPLSSTMLFCAVKGDLMICGHIGDGLICKVSPSGVSPITLPQNGENASTTFFVTFPNAQEYLRLIRTTTDDTHAILLMTDGVEDLVYDSSKYFVMPVVARIAEIMNNPREEIEKQLSQTVRSFFIDSAPYSDDASLGIIYFPNTRIPDFSMLATDKAIVKKDEHDTLTNLQKEMLPSVVRAKSILSPSKTPKTSEEESKDIEKMKKHIVAQDDSASSDEKPMDDNEKTTELDEKEDDSRGFAPPAWIFIVVLALFAISLCLAIYLLG